MAKALKMIFQLDGSKTVTCSLADPKDDLTKAAVEGVMQDMITKKALVVKGVSPTAIKEAVIMSTDKTPLV
jgi:hypothetical protein